MQQQKVFTTSLDTLLSKIGLAKMIHLAKIEYAALKGGNTDIQLRSICFWHILEIFNVPAFTLSAIIQTTYQFRSNVYYQVYNFVQRKHINLWIYLAVNICPPFNVTFLSIHNVFKLAESFRLTLESSLDTYTYQVSSHKINRNT